MLTSKFFLGLSGSVREKLKKHIFKDAKDVYGRKYRGYSD